jgi:hypothetical protein
MGLFIARTAGAMTFDVGQGEVDLISIAKLDAALGFSEEAPQTLESIECVPVTYGVQAETGPTPTRVHALANDTGFTAPPHIVIFPVTDTFVLSDGTPLKGNGVALRLTDPANPFTAHVCTFYDITLCGGAGMWADAEGGGTTPITTDVMLYHELSHCFHFVTGTTAPTNPQEEVNAEIDENDMRDVRGLTHRDVNSHNGGCGGGPPPDCCIVASLASESPYSAQVNHLRHFREHVLRRSEVGDDFFKHLHYDYYRFSPQVVDLMARQGTLRPLVLDYFVTPLLAACDLLVACTLGRGTDLARVLDGQAHDPRYGRLFSPPFLADLGLFLSLGDKTDEAAVADAVRRAGLHDSDVATLFRQIDPASLRLQFIEWALVDTLRIWQRGAELAASGVDAVTINERVRRSYGDWIALMPITAVWDAFSHLDFMRELDILGQYMFQPEARRIFGARLRKRHARFAADIDHWITSC